MGSGADQLSTVKSPLDGSYICNPCAEASGQLKKRAQESSVCTAAQGRCTFTESRLSVIISGLSIHSHQPATEAISAFVCLALGLPLCLRLRTDQIRRLPRLAEHLEQHLGRFLEQLDPVPEIGGMALDLAADLQPIPQQHRPQLSDQLLTGIARLPKDTAEIPLQAPFMAGGVDGFMGPGGAERCW